MRRTILGVFLYAFILLSCDNVIELNDPFIKIEQIIPNPANLGDTLSIFLKNFNSPLNVENIDQVKIILFGLDVSNSSTTDTLQATGLYDNLTKQEYGNFYHSDLTNSLSGNYQQIVQCIADTSYPSQSTLGLILNNRTTISSSDLILEINK